MPSAFPALLAALIACASPPTPGAAATSAPAPAASRPWVAGREADPAPAPFAVVEACQSPREEAEEGEDEPTGRSRVAAPVATGFGAGYPGRTTDSPAPTAVPRRRLLFLLHGRLTC